MSSLKSRLDKAEKAAATNGDGKEKRVSVQPIRFKTITLHLLSTSSLLMHKLGDITDRTKVSDEEMFERAIYHAAGSRPDKQLYGLPAASFNRSIEAAARFHKANAKHGDTFWKGAIRITADPEGMVPFASCTKPVMKIDQGRNDKGSVVRTVRALVAKWEVKLDISFNEAVLPIEVVVNQVIHAGFHVGVGAFRPEKGGTYGTFEVKIG